MAQNSTSLYPVLEKLAHQQHALAKEHFSVKLTQLLHQQTDLLCLFAQNSKSGRILEGEKWIPVSLLNSYNSRKILDCSIKPRIDSAFDELLDVLYKTQMTQDLKEIDSLNQELNSLDQLDESTNQNYLLRMRERMDSGFETQNDVYSVDYYENLPSPSDSILSGWSDDDKEEIYSPDDFVNSFPNNVEIKIENQNGSILEPEIQSPTLPVQTKTSISPSVQNLHPVIPKVPPPVPSPPKNSNNKINVVHIKTVEQAQKLFKDFPTLANQLQVAQPLPSLGGGALGGFVIVPNGTDGSFTRSNLISLAKSTQNLDSNSVTNFSVPQTVPALETKVSYSIGSNSSVANGSSGYVRIYVPPNNTPRVMLPKDTNGQQNAPETIVSPTFSSALFGSHPVTSPPKNKPSIHTKSILAIFQCDLCKAVFMNYGQCNKHVGDYHFTESERPTGYPQDYVKILDATSIAPSSVSSSPSSTDANEPLLPETTKTLSKPSPKESSSIKQSLNSIYKRSNLNSKNPFKPKEPQPRETNYQKTVKKLRVSAFPDGDWCPIMQEEEEKDETETVEVNTGNRTFTINQKRPLVQMMTEMTRARRNHQNGVMNVILPSVDTTRTNAQVKRKCQD